MTQITEFLRCFVRNTAKTQTLTPIHNTNCFIYNIGFDNWSVYSSATYVHYDQPGEVYENKIYIVDDSRPEVFDPAEEIWSSWPAAPNKSGLGPCLLTVNATFYLFGGATNTRGVQSFNHSSQNWTVLDSRFVPMDIYLSGCLALPNEEVLIVGSESASYKFSALYNARSNTWTPVADTLTVSKNGISLVALGSRIFAIGGSNTVNVTEEFHYDNNTWSPIETKLLTLHGGHHGVIALPAKMFEHLPGGCVGVQ